MYIYILYIYISACTRALCTYSPLSLSLLSLPPLLAAAEISILGVHGKPATLSLEKLWDRNISIHTGMVHCNTTSDFIDKIVKGEMDAATLISHSFPLERIEEVSEGLSSHRRKGGGRREREERDREREEREREREREERERERGERREREERERREKR